MYRLRRAASPRPDQRHKEPDHQHQHDGQDSQTRDMGRAGGLRLRRLRDRLHVSARDVGIRDVSEAGNLDVEDAVRGISGDALAGFPRHLFTGTFDGNRSGDVTFSGLGWPPRHRERLRRQYGKSPAATDAISES